MTSTTPVSATTVAQIVVAAGRMPSRAQRTIAVMSGIVGTISAALRGPVCSRPM